MIIANTYLTVLKLVSIVIPSYMLGLVSPLGFMMMCAIKLIHPEATAVSSLALLDCKFNKSDVNHIVDCERSRSDDRDIKSEELKKSNSTK